VESRDTGLQTNVDSSSDMGGPTAAAPISMLSATKMGVARGTEFFVKDLQTGAVCSKTLSHDGAYGKIRAGYVYVTIPSQDLLAIFPDDCTGTVIYRTVGDNPWHVETDGVTVWTVNSGDDTVSSIDGSNVVTPQPLGLSGASLLKVWYYNSALYIGSSNGIYRVEIPSYNTTLWFNDGVALSYIDGYHNGSNGYIAGIGHTGAADWLYIINVDNVSEYCTDLAMEATGQVTVGESADGITVYTLASDGGFPPHVLIWAHTPDVQQTTCGLATWTSVWDYGSGAPDAQPFDHVFIFPSSTPAVCGNNVIETGENCDDGDAQGGDGCSATCQQETGWTCTGQPSFCSENCGDTQIVGNEVCDGSNHGPHDCTTIGQGFTGGTLACNGTCDGWITTSCTAPQDCGNSSINPGEDCDGANLGLNECTTIGQGFTGGTLACTGGCLFDVSSCFTCGDNTKEDGELCDGSDHDLNDCTTIGMGFTGGTLACSGTCDAWVTTQCTSGPTCGNDLQENGELCDGIDLDQNDCTTIGMGFVGGVLDCNGQCNGWDTSLCTSPPDCGNGAIDGNEDCDDTNLNQQDCTSIPGGFTGGVLQCTAGCVFDTTQCTLPPICGNGVIEDGEECDDDQLAGQTCVSRGFDSGELACNPTTCQFDESACEYTQTCNAAPFLTLEIPSITTDTDAEYARHLEAVVLHGETQQCNSGCIVEDGHEVTWFSSFGRCIASVNWEGTKPFILTTEIYSADGEEAMVFFRSDAPHEFFHFADGKWILDHSGDDMEFWVGWRGVILAGTEGTNGIAGIGPVHPITNIRSPLVDPQDPQSPTVNNWFGLLPTNDIWNVGIATTPFDKNTVQFQSFSAEDDEMVVIDEYAPAPQVQKFDNPYVPDPEPKGGCCAAGGSSDGLPFVLLLGFWLVVRRRRRR